MGTLDLMILKTLHALGPQHWFGIALRIEQASEDGAPQGGGVDAVSNQFSPTQSGPSSLNV